MTNEEMIKWAQFPGTASADVNAVAEYEAKKRLIWIAQTQARKTLWAQLRDMCTTQTDAEALASYPEVLFRREQQA